MIPMHILFPKILPWRIATRMRTLALPFTVAHEFTSTYLSTLREGLTP